MLLQGKPGTSSPRCKQINFPLSKTHAFCITPQEERSQVHVPNFTLPDRTYLIHLSGGNGKENCLLSKVSLPLTSWDSSWG